MKKRNFSLLLAMLMLVSCGESAVIPEVTTDGETTSAEVKAPEETSGVPDGFTLNGEEIRIWSPSIGAAVSETYISMAAEEAGDVLSDAIYASNLAVEEKLDVKLTFDTDLSVNESPNKIRTLILADDTTYDAYHFIQYSGAALAAEDLYLNLKDAPYISFNKPWWDMKYMKEMTVGDEKLFVLVGDFATDRTRTLNCVFYNKKLCEDYYGDADKLNSEVLDGKWTVDRMREICAEVWSDQNSNGIADRDDVLGMAMNTVSNLDGYFYSMRGKITSRDSKDVPYLDFMTEKNMDVCQKLYDLVYSTDGIFLSGSSFDEEMINRKKFAENQSMFLTGFFYTAESLRDMNADYGIVPLPKFDESQDEYTTGLHNIMRDIALPVNCQNVEGVCAVLEELAYNGNKTVIPAYYEIVLKHKYARDEASSQMLDLIKSQCTTEIAYVYSLYFNEMGLIFRNMIAKKSASPASLYAEREAAAKKNMQTLIDKFMN